MDKAKKKRISIINTSMDLVAVLEMALQDAGFETDSMFTIQLKSGDISLDKYLSKKQPDLVLYDIAIPYEENFALFQRLKNECKNCTIPIILTTTNKMVLEKLIGKTDAIEIIGKPFDLNVLIEEIEKKLD